MAKVDKKYHKLLKKIIKKGFRYEDPNRKDVYRLQIPSYTFKHDFKDGFPAITTKKLYWKGVVGELLWFLRGDTNIKYLVDNGINIWNKDAYNWYLSNSNPNSDGHNNSLEEYIDFIANNTQLYDEEMSISKKGELGRVYGGQWRAWQDFTDIDGVILIDQISNLIKGLKENPMGTRHIVTAWNPAELYDMALPPFHGSFEILVEPRSHKELKEELSNLGAVYSLNMNTSQFEAFCFKRWKLRKYQFTLKWHQRSVDTFLGLPFNIASYALLAQIIGKMTNMIPKGIIGDLSNVHVYEPHLDAVKEQLSRDVNKYGNSKVNTYITDNAKEYYNDLDKFLNSINIEDFEQENYKSYPRIPAEMLAYNK